MNQPSQGGEKLDGRLTPHIPAAVVFWRRVRAMQQWELAKASGLCLSEVKWLERGRKNGFRTDTLEKVCEGLRISLQELLATAARIARELGL